jgi:4'-phosphopantetheinyl transferase
MYWFFFMNFGEITTMPLFLRQDILNNGQMAVWHITESAEELLNLLPQSLQEEGLRTPIKNEQLFKQRLASRLLIAHLLPQTSILLGKQGDKRTHLLSPHLHLSISHAGDYAAVIISSVPVGIDIEVIHPRIQKIASRFMHPTEWEYLQHPEDFKTLMFIWSVKEAVFKMANISGLDFQTQILCKPFNLKNEGKIEVELHTLANVRLLQLTYSIWGDMILVFV